MYEVELHGEAVAGESVKIRKQLEGLIENWNKSTFDIAELLHTVKHKGFYKAYGFNTFLEYVSELDIKTRKAQYLVRIVDIMDEINIPREEYQPVGIAKLREITSLDIVDEDGDPALYHDEETKNDILVSDIVKGLVAKAPAMSLDEIKKYVKIVKGLTGDNDITWLNISVNTQALNETIKPALELAKKNLGTSYKDDEGMSHDYSDGKALEVISTEYLNDPANNPEEWK